MYKGRIDTLKIKSSHIPHHDRDHYVYIPQEADNIKDLASIYLLAPWLSSGVEQTYFKPFKTSFPQRIDKLIEEGCIPPCIVIFPDLYTPYGGSQYIDSRYFGDHASFITDDLIKTIENKYFVSTRAGDRLVLGRSSGGFGALRLGIDFPDTFGGVACHSGDLGFDTCMRGSLIDLCKVLQPYAKPQEFVDKCFSAKKVHSSDLNAMMLLGLCGFYSPRDDRSSYDIPINLHTGEIIQDVWRCWEDHDPVKRLKDDSFKKSKFLYIDCGTKDQYNLLYGARQMHEKLNKYKISHHYFEFNDNHSGTDYRYDDSLKLFFTA